MKIIDMNRKFFFDVGYSVLVGVICSYLLVNTYAYATAYFPFSYEKILPESRAVAKYVFMLIQLVIFWITVLVSVGIGSVILGRLISDKAIFNGLLLAMVVVSSWTFWMYFDSYGHEVPVGSDFLAKNLVSNFLEVLIVVITSCFLTSLAFKRKNSPRR